LKRGRLFYREDMLLIVVACQEDAGYAGMVIWFMFVDPSLLYQEKRLIVIIKNMLVCCIYYAL
jgi:hypothetical protein